MLGKAEQELLKACQQRNIKVDGVFNHSSRGFSFSTMFWKMAPFPWVDWFKIEGWPLSPYNGEFPAYAGWASGEVFNHDNEVREEIAEYWIKFGDGWRLDVPFEVRTPVFGRSFVIASKPLIRKLVLGEVTRVLMALSLTG